jgi:hypothetical protein
MQLIAFSSVKNREIAAWRAPLRRMAGAMELQSADYPHLQSVTIGENLCNM